MILILGPDFDKILNMQSNQLKIKELNEYFEKQKNVLMAFVFGSFAKDQALYDSDADIAIYFKPKGKALEWEEDDYYPEEDRIWRDLENILKRDVDLLILNRASSRLAFKVLRMGIPIVIKDRSLYWRYFLTISSIAEEFREFIRNYRRIRERSKSLTEEDKERLETLIDFLEEEIKSYYEFQSLTQSIYESDRKQKRNVEHWVESIVLSSIDIAEVALASQKIRTPEKYKDILKSLSLLSGFDKETAERLSKFAGLRNIITHEYLDIRWQRIQEFIRVSKPLYEYLVKFVKDNYLKE